MYFSELKALFRGRALRSDPGPQSLPPKSEQGYRLPDYLLIAVTVALSFAVKFAAAPFAQIVTGPLMIPGGVAAGGVYMLFLVLPAAIIAKRGTALLTALLQAVLMTVTGAPGSHGAASLLTYTLPGFAVEAVWLVSGKQAGGAVCCFMAGIAANVAGTAAVNGMLFGLPAVPLLLSLCVAALSGGLGGWAAYGLSQRLQQFRVGKRQGK
jgi:ABC-type thiamin/hydroxymethylpyrimidine transport system permease subunit